MPEVQDQEQLAREAAAGGEVKGRYVREMFSDIAPSYDLLNHLLSFNIDKRWRRKALGELGWERNPGGVYLDLCAGTLDVAVGLAGMQGFQGTVLGADFAEPMLRMGRGKISGGGVVPVVGDALALPLADGVCSGAIVAFGIRNVADLTSGLREVYRVLSPGARFVILEFSTPRSPLVRFGYLAYFHRILPLAGRVISGHKTAYSYLPASVANFPVEEALAAEMRSVGFSGVRWKRLSFGVAAIHIGEKSVDV